MYKEAVHNPALSSEIAGIRILNGQLTYKTEQKPTLANLNMLFPYRKWSCILGQSGCGKTSLLRYLAGLLTDKVEWQGSVSGTLAEDLHNHIAYMAQQDLLMPWLTVVENVCLSLKFGKQVQTQSDHSKAIELLELVGLSAYQNHLPHQLSGGMRQRIALARTLMQDKPVVLMDEPFSALDAVSRHKLQNLAADVLSGKTVILITHDPVEAARLGEQIFILQGKPAKAVSIEAPELPIPRAFTGELALLSQEIIQMLEAQHD